MHAMLRKGWMLTTIVAVFVMSIAVVNISVADSADDSDDEKETILIRSEAWYLLGPIGVPLAAFNEDAKEKEGAAELLSYEHVTRRYLDPAATPVVMTLDGDIKWSKVDVVDGGVSIKISSIDASSINASSGAPGVAYLAAYLDVPRWGEVKFEVRSNAAFELFVDGNSLVKRKKAGDADDEKSGSGKFEMGKHLIVVKTVCMPDDSLEAWTIDIGVVMDEDADVHPTLTTDPTRTMNIADVLDGPGANGIRVSPDGKYFTINIWTREYPEGTRDSQIEIRRFKDNTLVRTLRDMANTSAWRWAPTGNRLSYVKRDDDKGSLRVIDLDTGTIETIVKSLKDFDSYSWSPDGSFIVYSVNVEPEKNKTGVKRFRTLSDRRCGDRDRTHLYMTTVPGGSSRRVSSGEHGAYIYDIHPDGKQLLIGRGWEDISVRPYSTEELVVVNLVDQSTKVIWKGSFLGTCRYSPDGSKILAMGGPSAFGTVGVNVPDGVIPNDYDTQVYIFDPETGEADPITREFDPSILSSYWPNSGGDIYMVAQAGEFVNLYRYNIKKRSYKHIEIDCDVIRARSVASDVPVAVMVGVKANRPAVVYGIDLKRGKVREMMSPAAERFKNIAIGEVRDWNFTASNGKEIVGRMHLPPNFDESRKWPCIVYYYGGTSPVSRGFAGRYPKNLWAANGYVVYVLQPSGATGFGQEFSAAHVNDWGKTSADEIIDGVRQFIAANSFIDGDRVGCIGASYGGFMTELLVTKTDIFAAAVSHAGISDITSYWGEGYWGYGYNAVAAANSFPWNRKDIYIDQSPLFNADKVNTPLLLLHGGSDTNVPRGESDQMFTALKLLGKEVEYIQVEGQDHWILDYKKRVVWSNAIVSWFDRWLKDESDWWNDSYPPLEDDEAEEKPAQP